jgi:Protein of unknown function (DUF1565)
MPDLSPRVLYVSTSDPNAYKTISQAAQNASEGDQIIVAPGTYDVECFPIYIPPRCQLIGAGPDKCKIDGGGSKDIADRPLNPFQSLVLLGDESTLSRFSICNSGGNGVSNEHGARMLITDNILQDNGQHGLLVFGTNGAIVQNNCFINNGTKKRKYKGPRPISAKQGHHIYVESRSGTANDVAIIGNIMDKVWADAIANDVFDQSEGISMRMRIIGNDISDCGRNGLSIASSYGPSNSSVFVEIRNNRIFQCEVAAIDALAALPIVNRTVYNAKLFINIVQNEIDGCKYGINTFAAFGAAENSQLHCNIIENSIVNATRYGVTVMSGASIENWPVEHSRLHAVIANHRFSKIAKPPIFIQGGGAVPPQKDPVNPKMVKDNIVFAYVTGNQVSTAEDIIVNNGFESNYVNILDGSQSHAKKCVDNDCYDWS